MPAAVSDDTLDVRMEHPTEVTADDIEAAEQPDWHQHLATVLDPAPTVG